MSAPTPRLLLVALLLSPLAACGSSSSGGPDFSMQVTSRVTSSTAPIALAGDLMVYLANEAANGPAGTPLNGDGDANDLVAFAVNLAARSETNLGVAALAAVVLGREVYLQVDESADGVDWSGDMVQDDFVLLHWSESLGSPMSGNVPAFVDVLPAGARLVASAGMLFYASAGPVLGVSDETTLRRIDPADPAVFQAVQAPMGAFPGLASVRPLGEESGALFCALDEVADAQDYNGDVDFMDATVLALVDATDADPRVMNVGLALADDDEPVRALFVASHDWTVAFLVDEASQGGANLNGLALPICPMADTDAFDRVLHYLEFSGSPAVPDVATNTGLAGHDRVLVGDGFVATLSNEADATCNMNATTGDTDMNDDILRWYSTRAPLGPGVGPEDMHAVAIGTGGGSMGVAVLSNRLIAVIDEAADDSDFDTQPGEAVADHDLIAWLDPAAADPTWVFAHQSGSNRGIGTGVFDSSGDSEPYAGTNWMAAEAVGGRLPLVYLESVPGATNPDLGSLNTNLDCGLVQKDTDKVDGLPVWADFASGPILDFDGVGYAVQLAAPGVAVAGGVVFFRVSEADDNVDYNNDGDKADVVLFRNPLTTCGPVAMSLAMPVAGPAVVTDGLTGAAFLAPDSLDVDGDGVLTETVVRYFRF